MTRTRLEVYTMKSNKTRTRFTHEQIEQAKQWIADDYHCSGIWGQRQTYAEMKLELQETLKWKDPEDYSPPVGMYRVCADYWNELCTLFPA